MKESEPEYVRSADKQTWMDTTVISDYPLKTTIIDPRQFVQPMANLFDQLPYFQENYTMPDIEILAKTTVISLMNGIIGRARAWTNGDDVEISLHLNSIRSIVGADMEPEVREIFRDELYHSKHSRIQYRMDLLIGEIQEFMKKHMNPNRFTVHKLTYTQDARTLMLEEYADWRVIQYTQNELAKIDAREEDV